LDPEYECGSRHEVTVHSPTRHLSTVLDVPGAVDGDADPDGTGAVVEAACGTFARGAAPRPFSRTRTTATVPDTRAITITVSMNNGTASGLRGGRASTGGGYPVPAGGPLVTTGYAATLALPATPDVAEW
jgi:hypothetical protein